MKAIVTLAAACTPPEFENRSTNKPNIKLKKIKSVRLLFAGNNNINKM
jgi:hypothetical protein